MLVLGSAVTTVVCLLLAATPVFPERRAGRWVLYYLSGFCQASNSMFWAWTQETLSGDPATRAFASAGLNVWASVSHAAIPLALFRTVDQPAVVAGNYGAAGFSILHMLTSLALAYLQHRRRQGARGAVRDVADGDDDEAVDAPVDGAGAKTTRATASTVPDDSSLTDSGLNSKHNKGAAGE